MLKFMTPLFIGTTSLMGIMVMDDTTAAKNTKVDYFSSQDRTAESYNHARHIHATRQGKTFEPNDHSHHDHDLREVSQLANVPTLAIEVSEDSFANGWNIQLHTENFVFSPAHASSKNVDNEGHAHIFIDDKKIARAYGHWHYVFGLTPGRHTIRVSLNDNEHETLAVNGQPVQATSVIIQRAAE